MVDNYCVGCKLRLHNRTEKGDFCKAEYTQTPLSYEATKSVINDKGSVCSFNPWRAKILGEMRGRK